MFLTYDATLNFQGKSVSVKVHERGGKLEECPIKEITFGNPWNQAHLENGEVAYFQFLDYEDSIPFRDNVDIEAYNKAITALTELEWAYQKYRDSMAALGAVKKEEGTYGDYHSWLEIPDVPDIKWVDI